jgi:hypothetical protein
MQFDLRLASVDDLSALVPLVTAYHEFESNKRAQRLYEAAGFEPRSKYQLMTRYLI